MSIQKALNSSRGVIGCRDLADMTEKEICNELKEQGVITVCRVTLKKGDTVTYTNTLFLTFNRPDLPKVLRIGYPQVKVDLFVPNPLRCFGCNKFGHTSDKCRVGPKCVRCGKQKHEGECEGPQMCSNCNGPHASSAKDCPIWKKEKEIQSVRIEKRIPFPEARKLVEAMSPSVVPSSVVSYASVTQSKRTVVMSSASSQTDLTWVLFVCFIA